MSWDSSIQLVEPQVQLFQHGELTKCCWDRSAETVFATGKINLWGDSSQPGSTGLGSIEWFEKQKNAGKDVDISVALLNIARCYELLGDNVSACKYYTDFENYYEIKSSIINRK